MDVTRTRLGNYSVKWTPAGGSLYDFGGVDKVTPDIQLVTKPIKMGTVGDVELGKRIIAVTGSIKVESREVDAAFWQTVMPWYTSGPIRLNPATILKDLYDYAGLLTLHPTDVADDDTTQDITLLKAVPLVTPMDRDGEADDRVLTEFFFFPDREQLPLLDYGYIGAAP